MTEKDFAALTLPFVASAVTAYLVVDGWDLTAWMARGVTFGITFGFVLIFWRRNKHRAGTWQDILDLLPRFKGTKK